MWIEVFWFGNWFTAWAKSVATDEVWTSGVKPEGVDGVWAQMSDDGPYRFFAADKVRPLTSVSSQKEKYCAN